MVVFSSCCYSEIITGQSSNAAATGYTWDMTDVLPPQAGLTVNGVYHRYSIEKDPNAAATVTIQNEDAVDGGYVYQRVDDWTGLPGNTKVGFDPLVGEIPATKFGNGEIVVNGDGSITDATILYTYRYDTCYNPIADASCPGYESALYQYLLDNNLLNGADVNDPFYDEYVQNVLDQETEVEEVEQTESEEPEEEKEERSLEDMLAIAGAAEEIGDVAQQAAMLAQLANIERIESYYDVTINGGVYTDSLKFEDKDIQDNRKALRNLGQQKLHRDMVRSQYD